MTGIGRKFGFRPVSNSFLAAAVIFFSATGTALADWYDHPKITGAVSWNGDNVLAVEGEYITWTPGSHDFASLVSSLGLPIVDYVDLGFQSGDVFAFYTTVPSGEVFAWQNTYGTYLSSIEPNMVILPIEPPGGLRIDNTVQFRNLDLGTTVPEPSAAFCIVAAAIPLLVGRKRLTRA